MENSHLQRDSKRQLIPMKKLKRPPSPLSKFSQYPNMSVIGPHLEVSTYTPLNLETQEQQVDNSQKKSVTFSSSSLKNIDSPKLTLQTKSFVRAILEMTQAKQKKQTVQNVKDLREVLIQQKVKIIVKNFIKKLSRNNINSKPIEFTPFFNQKELSFLDTQGIEINHYFQIAFFLCSIFLIIVISILITLSLVFSEIQSSTVFNAFQSVCLIYFSFQILLNLITVKFQQGKRLGTLRQILRYCIRKNLITDAWTIGILFIDLFFDSSYSQIAYLRIIIIFKLSQVFEKIEKLQIFFIRNFYYEQYWDLIKVFLFNFSLAHILAIFLVAMASINMQQSWMNQKRIIQSEWYEKYVWAYYWATTIMLTVGFGDLTATNYEEAIVVTLIETISCIALAYNINRVGMLISNIRAQDLDKGKNFKIFYSLSRKNDLSEDLDWRINNYIEESSNIKKQFNYEEQNQFVDKLPQGLKTEFLKESNKKVFKNLPFFKNLMELTVFTFAQKIQMNICHPEQIIQRLDDPHNLLILKGGEIGFTCKRPGCKFNSTVIDQLKIGNLANPVLISLGFINNPRLNYEIKSLAYSILYFMDYENILTILKGSQMDYELYCLLKDKAQIIPDEFQMLNCEICKGKHTKFNCPKLHYIPFKQLITNRYIHKVKHDKNRRFKANRFSKFNLQPLKIYKNNLQEQAQIQSKSKSIENTIIDLHQITKTDTSYLKRKFQDLDEAPPNNFIKEISQIKDFFSKNTVELIKYQMTKALSVGQSHDQVWIVESDKMKNYKNYFENDNSCNLIQKFNVQKRVSVFQSIHSLKKSTRHGMKESRRIK